MWGQRFPDFLQLWELLEAAGLRPVMMEANLIYVNYNRASGAELAEVSPLSRSFNHWLSRASSSGLRDTTLSRFVL